MSADADRLAQIVDRVLVEGATTLPPDDLSLLAGEAHALRGALHLAMRALNTACGVLQEASGLPDEIDDPDARDDMVLTLRPRAEKAEAEVERLTDLCGEFRKREERLNAEVERLRGWIDRSERQEARARRAEAEVARLTAERDAVIERLERVIDQWRKTGRAVISEMNRADKAEAERDALAAQVARVEKLAEEWSTELDENRCPAHAFPGCDCHEGYHHAWDDLRAALGAMGANQ